MLPLNILMQVEKMSSIIYKNCSKCGAHLVLQRETIGVCTSPIQYRYECPECGNVEYDTKYYSGNLTTEDSMDYKKKYEATLQTARQWIADGCSDTAKIALEATFPELRESEDERIREDIVAAVEMYGDFTQGRKEKIYAYLEKQKELTKENVIKELEKEFYACSTTPKWFHKTVQDAINIGKAEAFREIQKEYDRVRGKEIADIDYGIAMKKWEEKQKEPKDYHKLYADIAKSKWFKKAYEGKSLGCDNEQEEQMMKDAVECELYRDGDCLAIDLDMEKLGYTEDDKVKIIIVTEGEK